MKMLKNCVKLSSQVKIYVPSTVNVDKAIDSSEWVDKALVLLSQCFGGATSSKALGAWVTQSGKLVKEDVTLVFAFADQSKLETCIELLYDFCLKMKIELSQEAIAMELNGDLYLV